MLDDNPSRPDGSASPHQKSRLTIGRGAGQLLIGSIILSGAYMIYKGGHSTYMGLILVWAGPFIFLLWSIGYHFLTTLPLLNTIFPIFLPTLYLWLVDTWALQRGTWVIGDNTKLKIHIWDGLEIEEAVFFLVTNTLVVLGQIACDQTIAVIEAFPNAFPASSLIPSLQYSIRSIFLSPKDYDFDRIQGLGQAVRRLRNKSRSFYLASATFSGRLRIDLILLYSFCRVADDLIDDAMTAEETEQNLGNLASYLNIACSDRESKDARDRRIQSWINARFPGFSLAALRYLPASILPKAPFDDLLNGFKTDSEFHEVKFTQGLTTWPMSTEEDLDRYAYRVAGTVAELCLELVFHHHGKDMASSQRSRLIKAGGRMGAALQCVNIARDIEVDAKIGRVYLPTTWLKKHEISPEHIIKDPGLPQVEALRDQMLDKAEKIYNEARPAIEELPPEARGPMRVAVESYMEIGRVLREKRYRIKAGRASVPKMRRFWVGWKAMIQG
ncbi:MAG: hypothetical protein M1825_003762 [Sarcosagium campestre]|nr:MAG: hypothetical protein M1825_003762 [Sarcosagium campestre]